VNNGLLNEVIVTKFYRVAQAPVVVVFDIEYVCCHATGSDSVMLSILLDGQSVSWAEKAVTVFDCSRLSRYACVTWVCILAHSDCDTL
jgi:hypothetical protein